MAHIIVNEKLVDLPLESVSDYSLLDHLQYLYQDIYDHETYNACPIDIHFPKVF